MMLIRLYNHVRNVSRKVAKFIVIWEEKTNFIINNMSHIIFLDETRIHVHELWKTYSTFFLQNYAKYASYVNLKPSYGYK